VIISPYHLRQTWDAQGKAVLSLHKVGTSVEDIARVTGLGENEVIRTIKCFRETDPETMEELKERDWRELFHTPYQLLNAPPVEFAIHGWLQEGGITMYGGLPGHGKTLLGMSTVKALLTGAPLFGYEYFQVRKAKRVLYLSPEVGISGLVHRLRLFGLMPFVESGSLLVRSLGSPDVPLTDDGILNAAEGADVFLDTAVRFMEGDENSSSEQKVFTGNLFALLNAGARDVIGLHHSAKGASGVSDMTLENTLRGSGEIGAMLSTAWGLRQVDGAKNQIYVANLKARDFDTVGPFVLEGRPWIDQTGDLKMVHLPGQAGRMSDHAGRSSVSPDALNEIARLRKGGKSVREIAEETGLSKSVVGRQLKEASRWDSPEKTP
jgi:transposase-like protein